MELVAATDADPTKTRRLPRGVRGEKGVTGLESVEGKIKQEYNAALATLSSRMTTYEEMRRSDTAIAVMESLLSLPIRGTNWLILPGDDKDLADQIAQNLGIGGYPGSMTQTWDEMLRQILLAPLYGFTVHEKVFEEKEGGFLGWRKFPERPRTTVDGWLFDDAGGLQGIRQKGYKAGTYDIKTTEIPIEKLAVWSWRPDGGDPEGLGMMRQAYKAWMYKAAFEEFAAIRIERQACGMPIAHGPEEGYDEDEEEAVVSVLQRLRTGEESGMLVPHGWTLEMLSLGAADVPFEMHLERENGYILQSGLMGFIGLGQGGDTGAWALSRDLSSLFLMVLNAIADWVCEGFNNYIIPQIVGFNANGVKELPRLAHGSLAIRDPRVMAETVKEIFDPELDLRHRAPEVETALRAMLELPPVPKDAKDVPAVEEETDSTEKPEIEEVVDDGNDE